MLLHNSYARNSHIKFFVSCTEVLGPKSHAAKDSKSKLYDHRPLALDNDNYLRVLQIPKKKVG